MRRLWCVALLCLGAFFPMPSMAAPQDADVIDVVVVIDNSGSMHSKVVNTMVAADGFGRGSDPHGLRYEATKMLVDLLDPADRIGIVHFSDSTHILGSDQTLVRMDDTQRTGMRTALDAVSVNYDTTPRGPNNRYGVISDPHVPPGQTAYVAALQRATTLLQQNKSSNRQALILLTDGAPTDMGQTPDAINAAMQRQLDAVGVPVFLLMLKNPNETANADVAAVTAAATARNHKVIEIASPADIAHAMASVLTYLKPNLYIDTLTATPGTGRDQSVVTASLTAAHRVSAVTFVFAAAPMRTPLQVTTSAALLQPGNTTRVQTFRMRQTDDITGAWTFRANAPPTTITGFALMQSQVRMTLRYPDARAHTSQIMAYPRDAAHVIGAVVDGVTPATLAQMRLESMTRCDTVVPDTAPTPYTTRTTGLSSASQPLIWALAPASAQSLFVNVRFQPSNTLALQRCYAMQATATPLTLTMRQPVSERPDVVAGTLPVELVLPPARVLRDPEATLFATRGNTPPSQIPFTVTNDVARAALAIPQAGSYALDMLVTGQYDGRPLALYASRTLTPQLACALRRVGRDDTRDLGVLTRDTALDVSLTCATAGDGDPQPLDAQAVTLVDAQNTPVPAALLAKLIALAPVQQRDGQVTWPLTLKNVALLAAGTYTLRVPVTIYGRVAEVQYTFTRPQDMLALSWGQGQAGTGVLDMGTMQADANTLYACVTATATALVADVTLAPQGQIQALRTAHTTLARDAATFTIGRSAATCPAAYTLTLVVPAPLDAATYTADVVLTASNDQVQVTPQPLTVRFTTAPLRVALDFAHPVAQTQLPTYQVTLPRTGNVWDMVDVMIPYTATVSGALEMPVLTRPGYALTTGVDVRADVASFVAVNPYWERAAPQPYAANVYTGALVLADVPSYTWQGGAYDVEVTLDDVRISSAKRVAFRVQTGSYLQLVLALTVTLTATLAITLGVRRFRRRPPAAEPPPYVPPPC
ncbi:MAG: hypothetical protein RL076_2222 [Chloroflexota bacterium]